MPPQAVTIFVLTYVGVALGRVPGLMLDRTGIALLGAIGMVISGGIPPEHVLGSIDFPTILLLCALMLISAQLRLGGFYTWIAFKSTSLLYNPRLFLLVSMLLSAVLSAILANDIICLAFTPVLAVVLLKAGRNPIPFLLGLAISSNIGSAATIIGNPQNMLIGQVARLHFGAFMLWCAPPSLLALLASYFFICRVYKHHLILPTRKADEIHEASWPVFSRWQSGKGIIAVAILIILFFTSIPREYSAIAVAGTILCSRKMRSRHILELIDWHLITLFCALFIVIRAITLGDIPSHIIEFLTHLGVNVHNLFILTGISTIMSNFVSNVPATMLLTRFLDSANPIEWYVLAVSSTFSGNLIVIGSIANLIVIEQAKNCGIEISFKEHAKVGIPVTLFSLAILVGWIFVGT
ncbi:MAG: anion transporter [Deltaproteobacteria bacterium]|nr:anion transporter [Deltaproteobacteria bacterium]